jgi:hypothetical protein
VLNLPPPVRQALEASDTLVLEALYDDGDERRLRDSMQNPRGVRLSDLVRPDLFDRVRAILGDAGYAEAALQRYKPWAAALLVAYPRRGQPVFLDRMLYLDARAAGKRTLGLETLAEQAAVFDELPRPDQVEMLADAVERRADQEDLLERIVSAYLNDDLPALLRLYRRHSAEGRPGERALSRRLVGERNRVMAQRLLPLFNEGGVFAAVGALHLPGEGGLLALLRRQGAVVRPVTIRD